MTKLTDSKPKSSRSRILRRLFFGTTMIAVSSLVALLLAELGVRVLGIGSDQFLRADPVLGVRFISSKSGLSQGPCYSARVSTNAQGWRSHEVSPNKPDDVYRVLVLGDSFMAGLQVSDDETFSSVLESQLNLRSLPRRVEVLNFGVPSWGTDQEYLSLREYGLSLKPDLVLLAFYSQNDVSDNSLALLSKSSTYAKPFFDLRDGKIIELPFSDRTPALVAAGQRMAAHLRLYPLVRDSLLQFRITHQILYTVGLVGVVPQERPVAANSKAGILSWPDRWRAQIGVYKQNYPNDWVGAWTITERILSEIRDLSVKSGAEFLLVQVSDPVVVMPAFLRSGLTGDDTTDVLDVDKPARLLEEFSHQKNLSFMSLVPGFRDRVGSSEQEFEKYYLKCDGHWTSAGHRLAADLVVPRIAEAITRNSR